MKQFAKRMKRGLAMLLALAMVLSCVPAGLITLTRAEGLKGSSANLSDLLVKDENYGGKLAALEKIIRSGMLKAEKQIAYEQPEKGVVDVDSAAKKITAKKSNGWTPVSAAIMVGTEKMETVQLTDGVGYYDYAGNAFSVVVSYELYLSVDKNAQLALMNAAYYLSQDNANVAVLRDGIVEQILAELVAENAELKNAATEIQLDGYTALDLINQLATTGIELPALTLGGKTTTLKFLDVVSESVDDAEALLADKKDDGKLALETVLTKYSPLSNLELIDLHSAELVKALKANYDNINALAYDDYGLAYVLKVLAKYNKDAVKAIADAKTELAEKKELLAQLKDKLTQLNTTKAQLQEARSKLDQAKDLVKQYDEGKAKLDAELMEKLGTSDYDTVKQLLALFGDPTGGELTEALKYVEEYADEVETARAYIAEYEPQLIKAEEQLAQAEAEADAMLKEQGMSLATVEQDIINAEKQIADAEAYIANAETVLLPQLAQVETALDTLIKVLQKFCTTVAPAYQCDWNVVTKDILVDTLTTAQYTKLSKLVADLAEVSLFTADDVKSELYAATTEVQYNMSMFNVNIELTVYKLDGKIGSNNLIVGETVTGVVTLEQGATKAAIQAAIDNAGLTTVTDLTHYAEAVVSALPDTLTKDITYTIKYYPNEYTYEIVDAGNQIASGTVYHGYRLRLPAFEGTDEQVYEYNVGGTLYSQNEIVEITKAMSIVRSQGKPRTGILLKDMLSGNMAGALTANGAAYSLSEKAQAILRNAALISGDIRVRVPGEDAKIEYVGTDVVASKYSSDRNGLYWVPASVDFIDANGNKTNVACVDGVAAIPAVDYVRISVNYTLVTDFAESDVLAMLNLPKQLTEEYNAQKDALAILDAKYSALGQLDKSKVGMLVTVAKDKNLGKDIIGAAESIRDNCLSENGKLKLYNLLTGYRADGMAYYYRNYKVFAEQTQLLIAALETLWGNAANQSKLLNVMYEYADVLGMTKEEIDGYVEPLGLLLEALGAMELTAPNAAIDVKNEKLPELVAAIAAAGKVDSYTTAVAPELYTSVGKNADNYTSVEVRVYVNGALVILPDSLVDSLVYKLSNQTNSYVITAKDAADIAKMVEGALSYAKQNAAFNLDAFYTCEVIGKAPVKGDAIATAQVITYNFTAKEYIAEVEGAGDQILSVDTTLKVTLPASGTNTLRYEYMVDGVKVPAGTYTFTTEQLNRLFTAGTYTITRITTELDPVGDTLQAVVNGMNGGDVKVDLESTKGEDGKYSYVLNMRIPTSIMSNPNAMTQVGMALFSSYTYIEMNDEVLLNGTNLYVQALLNGIMNSGLSGKTLQTIAANNGGLLMSTKLTLAAYEDDVNKVTTTLNIYFEGDSAEMDQMADAIAYFERYITISCKDGGLVLDMTMPEKAYQAYLAAMLVLAQRDFKNINDMDGKVAMGYILDVIDPVLTNPDLDLATFTNTLALLGYDIDGSKFEPYFDRMLAFYNALVWNYDSNGVATNLTGRESAVNLLKSKLGALGAMVKDEKISINVTMNLTNLEQDYEAAYLDISADGITNKVGMIPSLAGKTFAGKTVIVLLSDVGSANAPVSLKFNDTTVIDLNGYTIYGDLTAANGTVYIVDSSLDQLSEGGVTGKISGNVTVTAGTYTQDMTANLKAGYSQTASGAIRNDFYSIEQDAKGNYTVTLKGDAVRPNNLPNVKALAMDMLFDLVMNGYANGSLSIGGCQIYDFALEDVVALYLSDSKFDDLLDDIINGTANQSPWFNVSDLAKLYNMLVADLTNFKNIASGDYLAQYEIVTAPWDIYVYVDGDHITADLGAVRDGTKSVTFTIVLADDATGDEIRDLAGELGNVVDVKSELEMTQNKDGNKIHFGANYKQSAIVINLSTDINYIYMIGTLLADVVADPTALNKGLEELENYGSTRTLKMAIDNCTISDVLTALSNVNKSYDFSKLGALSETYKEVLLLAGAAIRKLDIADKGNRKIGSMEREYATYVLDKENLSTTKSTGIKNYNVSVSVQIPSVSVTLILCDACGHSNPIKVDAKDPTCTEDGNVEYWYCEACGTYFADENCTRVIAKEDAIIPATGHDYKVTWTWSEDHTCATAEFTCTKCDAPAGYAKDELIESEITKNPTCTEEGTIVYFAAVTFEGKEYTDSKEVALKKLEHAYTSAPVWTWAEDFGSAKATFTCDHCGEEIVVNAAVTKEQTDATCLVDGKIVYTATAADSNGMNYTDVKVEPLTATGHDYKVTWTWTVGFTAAKATFTCTGCTDVNDVLDAEVTTNGNGVYVATVTYQGKLYTDIQTDEHTFVLDGWTWSDDCSKATAHFTCNSCGQKLNVDVQTTAQTTDATCDKEGEILYTATLTLNGQTYTATKSVSVPKADHTLEHTAANKPSCTEDGNIAYWYCSACGKYFADEACTKEITKAETVVPATDHSYTGEPTWAWAEDNAKAVAKFVCDTCGNIHYEETATQSATTKPSCTEAGKTVYTATVTFGGKTYTGTKEVEIPATGHYFEAAKSDWIWSEDHMSANVTVKCSCGATKELEALVSVKVVEATYEAPGAKTYTAIAFWNGQQFTATYVEELTYRLSIGEVTVDTNNKIVGSKVENGYIFLDVQPGGVTIEELMDLLWANFEADRLTHTFTNSKAGAALICNGSTLTLIAANKDGHTVEKTFVIIILGDVNGNGRIEVADNSLMAAVGVGNSKTVLNEYAMLAADVNFNGRLDVADIAKNANKVVHWDTYKSQL